MWVPICTFYPLLALKCPAAQVWGILSFVYKNPFVDIFATFSLYFQEDYEWNSCALIA